GVLIGLVILAGAAAGVNAGYNHAKLSNMEQNIISLRMNIQQLFSGASDYTGLTNTVAQAAGCVPQQFVKGSNLQNPYGGAITLAAGASNTYTISVDGIPNAACTKLSLFQSDAWTSVSVNGTDVSGGSVASVASACNSSSNSIIFTAR
ncbi:MAG: pilus assembly protein PilS, partial [Desulfovibrionaceae bacterium]|nr:pilus assembly protein PilS [Desulfovibrionaceae bacterium]